MLKKNQIKKYTAVVFAVVFIMSALFSQEHELTPEELLELENQEAAEAEKQHNKCYPCDTCGKNRIKCVWSN